MTRLSDGMQAVIMLRFMTTCRRMDCGTVDQVTSVGKEERYCVRKTSWRMAMVMTLWRIG